MSALRMCRTIMVAPTVATRVQAAPEPERPLGIALVSVGWELPCGAIMLDGNGRMIGVLNLGH